MEQYSNQIAATLTEALPYIQRFAGQTVVVKYGGAAMVDQGLQRSFALDVILLRAVGMYPVVVHGGGPHISRLLERLDISCRFEEGMRVTSPEVMEVVEMVLKGRINTSIVSLINSLGGKAVGLCGHDGNLLEAERMTITRPNARDEQPPEIIDLGLVGRVVKVNSQVLNALEHGQFIPVIAPVGPGPEGESLNINADYVASALASGLRAAKLVLLTDTPGVLDQKGNLINSLSPAEAARLKEQGVLKGGMIPKVKCCVEALESGVERTHIIDGRVPNALILEIFTDQGVGTIIQ